MTSDAGAEPEIIFVLAGVLRNVHGRLIETYGGLPGVRDENALESAIARPKQLVHYAGISSIPRLAGVLPWAILRGHPFTDGNKRSAFAALSIFVERNNCRLTCSEVEETALILRAAGGQITEEQWMAWVESVVVPK